MAMMSSYGNLFIVNYFKACSVYEEHIQHIFSARHVIFMFNNIE